jgi:hypothetical protein
LIIVNLVLCFFLSYLGLWYLSFVPSAVLSFLLRSRWTNNLASLGLSGAAGVIVPIFVSNTAIRLSAGSELAGIIGIPGGFAGPLLITALLAFLVSGLAAVVGSSFVDAN